MEDTEGVSVCQEGISNLRRHATEALVKVLMVHKAPVFPFKREAPTSGAIDRGAIGASVSENLFGLVWFGFLRQVLTWAS